MTGGPIRGQDLIGRLLVGLGVVHMSHREKLVEWHVGPGATWCCPHVAPGATWWSPHVTPGGHQSHPSTDCNLFITELTASHVCIYLAALL